MNSPPNRRRRGRHPSGPDRVWFASAGGLRRVRKRVSPIYVYVYTGRRELMIRARAREHAALCHPREKHTPTKCNLIFFSLLFRYRRTRFLRRDGWARVRT